MKEIIKKIPFDTILNISLKWSVITWGVTTLVAIVIFNKTINSYPELVLHSADPFSVSLYSLMRHLYFSLKGKVLLITMIVFDANFSIRCIQSFIMAKREKL